MSRPHRAWPGRAVIRPLEPRYAYFESLKRDLLARRGLPATTPVPISFTVSTNVFYRACGLGTCMAEAPHAHLVCATCYAARLGNLFCLTCLAFQAAIVVDVDHLALRAERKEAS